MKFISVLLSLAAVAIALPSQKRGQCANLSIRKEWRSLSQQERDQFHSAVKQLQKEPSNVQGQSLFDRFSRLHVEMSDDIHYTAAFMTWHRYYCYAREQSLRKVGYAGPIPYWDWTKDAGNLAASEVLSPTAGFGGNGSPTYDSSGNVYNCVQDGPYGVKSNFSIAYPQQHCLQRKFRQSNRFGGASQYSAAKIQNVMRNTRFVDFWHALEGGAHDSVHTDIAGDMAAAFSPDDSLFFMHHNNVDRLWAMWQAQNPARLTEYTGNIYQGQRDDDGSRYPLASLNDTISLRGLGDMPDVKVRDIMDTTSPTLCYTYDK